MRWRMMKMDMEEQSQMVLHIHVRTLHVKCCASFLQSVELNILA